jgi:hypothetical protein
MATMGDSGSSLVMANSRHMVLFSLLPVLGYGHRAKKSPPGHFYTVPEKHFCFWTVVFSFWEGGDKLTDSKKA